MRKLSLVYLLLLVLPLTLDGADARPVISKEAVKYAGAWKRSDAQAIISYLPPHVVQRSGGRAVMVAELEDQFAQARSMGATTLETTLGQPSAPKQIGRWLASVLPVTAVLQSSHLALTQQTHVLALSPDKGKKWSFLLLYEITQAELIAWFPEFRGKVFVPAPPAPKVSIVY